MNRTAERRIRLVDELFEQGQRAVAESAKGVRVGGVTAELGNLSKRDAAALYGEMDRWATDDPPPEARIAVVSMPDSDAPGRFAVRVTIVWDYSCKDIA